MKKYAILILVLIGCSKKETNQPLYDLQSDAKKLMSLAADVIHTKGDTTKMTALYTHGQLMRKRYSNDQEIEKAIRSASEIEKKLDGRYNIYLSYIEPDESQIGPPGCYQYLIEDVSTCDRQAAIRSGFAVALIAGGFVPYLVAQAAIFWEHSECVDRAHTDYARCMAKEQWYVPEKTLADSNFLPWVEPVVVEQ